MGNIINYSNEITLDFHERNFNDVDSLLLCILSYLDFSNFVGSPIFKGSNIPLNLLSPINSYEKALLNLGGTTRNTKLLDNICHNPRFKDLTLNYYSNIISPQKRISFGAITYILSPNLAYIAFRGTLFTTLDIHEDLSMSFHSPIPSQLEAINYLNIVGENLPNHYLLIGGHSKGGNLAVYAAMYCHDSVKVRILNIYNHDGPGFLKDTIDDVNFSSIKNRILKTVPKFSIVGRILSEENSYKVIDSIETGILQHDAYSWLIQNDDFSYLSNESMLSSYIHKTLNKWIYELPPKKREFFADTLYKLTVKNGINPESLLHTSWKEDLLDIIFSTGSALTDSEKKDMLDILTALISAAL